ncbi:schwannomin-interacting protein 1-like isoform X8 [Xyrauchen texanus]|uniref:schwannomin-interacting protein 1-like isoform X8 n=1 Tax=Xyrauchen texanus TaxID=154827 RepID=UPI002241C916|nr:schwannomin-interacting protein 1-like isoform X8 [Xyrauchen texanus]
MEPTEDFRSSLERIYTALSTQGSTVGQHDQTLAAQGQQIREILQTDLDRLTVEWPEIRGLRSHRETYEDTEDDCNSHLTALTSSESEEEEEEMEAKKEQSSKNGSRQRTEKQQGSSCSSTKKDKSGGFKNDVRAALSVLRHKLRLEQKQTVPPSEAVRERKHFKQSDLKNLSLKELKALRSSLSKDIHDLSSELVGRLLTRDQLRTEQDALLLECWNRGVSQVSGFIHTETLSKKGLCLS